MRVAVVGGSIGGLTTACLLAADGHDVTVHERSTSPLEERGAGIGFLPMTARFLRERAGIDLSTISVETSTIRTLGRDGSVRHEAAHSYLFSSWNTVYRRTLEQFDPARYLLGHDLVELDPHTPVLRFASGLVVEPDLAVCADGVGSTARQVVAPEARTSPAGYVAWRGVVHETDLSPSTRRALDGAITYYVYANSHILVYPIPGRDGSVDPGERLVNIVWYRNYLPGDDLDDLLTDRNGARREVSMPPGALRPEHVAEARAHARARLPAVIADVVDGIGELFIQVVVDVEVDRMRLGRTVLVGDSAFAARPHAAAGTAKAAADGWALRDALAAHPDDLDAALKAWEPGQIELGRSLLARTRAIGRRSQVDGTWVPGDPDLIFGLYGPGD